MFEKKAAYPVTEPRRVAFIGLGVMGYPWQVTFSQPVTA